MGKLKKVIALILSDSEIDEFWTVIQKNRQETCKGMNVSSFFHVLKNMVGCPRVDV